MPYKHTRNSTTRDSTPGDGWASEAQRSGSNLQQHLALGLPPSHQDADNDNDDTTLFRRPGEWVSQLSTLVGRKTPEKWEDLDAPFKRSVPAANRPQRPAARPRPPRPVPAARAVRESLEPVQAIEGGLQRSLRPAAPRPSRALLLSLPLFAALASLLVWNTPRAEWPLWRLPAGPTTLAAATRGLPMPPPPPAAEPPPAAAPLAAAAAPQPEPIVEDVPEASEPTPRVESKKLSPREARRARAAARRARRAERLSQRIQFSRPITPLPETSAGDEEQPSSSAASGTLQINSRPWARVLVNGKFVGHTPQRGLKLAAGWHRIRLINEPLGMSKSLDIEIRAGQTARYVEMLEEDAVAKP